MQVILTEEEYNTLKAEADAFKTTSNDYKKLTLKYTELKDKYNQLLVFGVSITNEKLKATVKQR